FDERITFRGPNMAVVGRGREACIKGYVDFVTNATITSCELSEPEIDVIGSTAIVLHPWKMTYIFNGQESTESGHDFWVLARQGDDWLCISRAMIVAQP